MIGRLQRAYEGNERCRFIAVPDINPETGESNFLFDVNPFTVEFFNDQAKLMDEITYRCLYKNDPIEREGLQFPSDQILRYLELPNEEPEARYAICDTKNKGTDFISFPVLWKYGDLYYVVDVICTDSSDYGVQYKRSTNLIVDNKVQIARIESNQGGDRFAYEIEQRVEEIGYPCKIESRYTTANKETKIIANSDWILKHCVFKDRSLYNTQSDYGIFMNFLETYSSKGKNKHDDVPDSLSSFSEWMDEGNRISKIEPMENPFRTIYG